MYNLFASSPLFVDFRTEAYFPIKVMPLDIIFIFGHEGIKWKNGPPFLSWLSHPLSH
jgi:hypothetical protein